MPVRVKLRSYSFVLFFVILLGVGVPSVAVPPVIVIAKSSACTEPLAPAVLNISSLNVEVTLLLSSLTVKKEMTGKNTIINNPIDTHILRQEYSERK